MGFLEGGVTAFTGRQLLSKEWLDMTAFHAAHSPMGWLCGHQPRFT